MVTILLVEDDPDIRETLTEILHYERYAVLTASHGREGLAVLASLHELPDVILLDLQMPVMDGREFRQELRAHPEWRSIPVVVYSGTPDFCPPGDLMPLAGNLVKPVEVPELLGVLQNCCPATERRSGEPDDTDYEADEPGLLAA